MLNYNNPLTELTHCPVCKSSVAYDKYDYYEKCICNKLNNLGPHFVKETYYINNKCNYENFRIGKYDLLFEKDMFVIFADKARVDLQNSEITFSDVDTIEKIETFIQNYNILC